MRKFILKLSIFLLPIFIVAGAAEYKAKLIKNEYQKKREITEQKIDSSEIIILGSSHTYYGIKAAIFDRPALNLAYRSQDLYYDSQILLKYLSKAAKLKLVVISVSYPSLEGSLEEVPDDWRTSFYLKFWGIPRKSGIPKLGDYTSIGLYGIKASRNYLLTDRMPEIEQIDETGSAAEFSSEDPEKILKGDNDFKAHELIMRKDLAFENLQILSNLIETLQAKNIEAVIITTPCFKTYYEKINSQKYDFMQESLKSLSSKYGVKYFNYLKDSRFDEYDFNNSSHLNTKGAEKFTRILKNEVMLDSAALANSYRRENSSNKD